MDATALATSFLIGAMTIPRDSALRFECTLHSRSLICQTDHSHPSTLRTIIVGSSERWRSLGLQDVFLVSLVGYAWPSGPWQKRSHAGLQGGPKGTQYSTVPSLVCLVILQCTGFCSMGTSRLADALGWTRSDAMFGNQKHADVCSVGKTSTTTTTARTTEQTA